MKNILKTNTFLYGVILLFGLTFVSCDATSDLDPGGTAVQDMAGDWFVHLLADDGTGTLADIYGIGFYKITTYNTSADDGTELFVDDHGLWPMKTIVNVNLGGKTFSGDALANEYDETITVNVMGGVITPGGATTTGGNTSDAISFRVIYSDDPGTEYTIEGYKRTGFFEDEH